jgi:hypothetical protein
LNTDSGAVKHDPYHAGQCWDRRLHALLSHAGVCRRQLKAGNWLLNLFSSRIFERSSNENIGAVKWDCYDE